jgi:hypothetical protein
LGCSVCASQTQRERILPLILCRISQRFPRTAPLLGHFCSTTTTTMGCTSDSQCPSGYMCVNGQCVPQQTTGTASISLTASATQVDVGQSVTFTATYLDPQGNPIPNATLYLFVNNAQISTATTNSSGVASWSTTFNQPGTYQVDVADNPNNT